MPRQLDFEAERDRGGDSWERADPHAALVEQFGRYGYRVTLPGGSVHHLALGHESGVYEGRCDCRGFEYQDGPCAHLCTVRKAVDLALTDDRDHPVTIQPMTEETVRVDPDAHADRVRADGGVRR
jgi:hypothetical protein